MANLAKHFELTNIESFQRRVRAAAVQAAVNISGEDSDETHAKSQVRQSFALRVLQGQINLEAIVWAVASNSTILMTYAAGPAGDDSTIPDGDLEYTMATVWDDLSGAAHIPAP